MQIALINLTKRNKKYPVGLLKIGSFLKDKGHSCKLYINRLPEKDKYDEIWISTLFTFEINFVKSFLEQIKDYKAKIKIGGISATLLPEQFKKYNVEIHQGLYEQAECYNPDYSLLEKEPEYSISYISRGCSRKCGFCMVHRLEPEFLMRKNWANDINNSKKIEFYDNNFLAIPEKELFEQIDKIKQIVKEKGIKEIDFNQGLDCRLLTEKIAKKLKGLPIKPVRFAFDGKQEDGHFQKAVELMANNGFKDFMTYTLYNYTDKPAYLYYRLKESILLAEKFNITCKNFLMRYQPILEVDKQRDYVGRYWTEKTRRSLMTIVAQSIQYGVISFTSGIKELEYWFGKNEKEFLTLLNYPKLKEYMKKKKGNLRLKRKDILYSK